MACMTTKYYKTIVNNEVRRTWQTWCGVYSVAMRWTISAPYVSTICTHYAHADNIYALATLAETSSVSHYRPVQIQLSIIRLISNFIIKIVCSVVWISVIQTQCVAQVAMDCDIKTKWESNGHTQTRQCTTICPVCFFNTQCTFMYDGLLSVIAVLNYVSFSNTMVLSIVMS